MCILPWLYLYRCDGFVFVEHPIQNMSVNTIHSTNFTEAYYEMVKISRVNQIDWIVATKIYIEQMTNDSYPSSSSIKVKLKTIYRIKFSMIF